MEVFIILLYTDQSAVFFTSQSDVCLFIYCLLSLVAYFSHMETSSWAEEGGKFLHKLGAYEQWFFRLTHLRQGDLVIFSNLVDPVNIHVFISLILLLPHLFYWVNE